MKVLWKCCIRSLKENKTRTMVTIIGVAMATVLITVFACICSSMLTSIDLFLLRLNGSAHETYFGVDAENLKYFRNNQSIQELWMERSLGLYELQMEGMTDGRASSGYGSMIKLLATQEGWFASQGYVLASGRFAEKEGEIVLPKTVRTDLGYDVKIGDHMEVTRGNEIRKLEIVGFMEKNGAGIEFDDEFGDFEVLTDLEGKRSYRVIEAYGPWSEEGTGEGKYDVSIRFTKAGLRHREEVTAALLGIPVEVYQNQVRSYFDTRNNTELSLRAEKYVLNESVVAVEGISPLHPTMLTVWGIAFAEVIFLLFVLAGVFCINNSFDISITERIRFYGMLSSVGTTKRQRRMLVWLEAFVIGAIGIVLGILLGIGLSLLLVLITNLILKAYVKALAFRMVFRVAWWAVMIAAVQSVFMIVLSAMEAAFRASRISPMDAIRSNDTVKNGARTGRAPRLIKRLFGVGGGIAALNFRRSKVKYRATTVSIAVSVALVLGMTFIPFLFQYLRGEIQGKQAYQVFVSIYEKDGDEKIREIAGWPGVTGSVTYRNQVAAYQFIEETEQEEKGRWVFAYSLVAWDDATFEKLCRDNGIDPKTVWGKGLITKACKWDFSVGELCRGMVSRDSNYPDEESGIPISVEIGGVIDPGTLYETISGISLQSEYMIFVNESFAQEHEEAFRKGASGCFTCEDASALTQSIRSRQYLDSRVINFDQFYQLVRLGKALVMTFLIGFLSLIIAIGVTNVINAVNSNLQLRASEFAKLRAIGMTTKQFRSMIHMEGWFIAVRGLFWGYLIGTGIYWGLHRFFVGSSDILFYEPGRKADYAFHIPFLQMICCGAVVGILLRLVMNAHVKKAVKSNVIETIRNENL